MIKNKFLIILFSLISIYAIIGFIAIPKIFKPQIEKIINENITQKASLEKIEFNPFLLKLSAYNLKIHDKKKTTVSVEKIYIDFSILKSLNEKHIGFKDLQLIHPFVNIIEYEDGSLNLENLLIKQTKEKEKKNKESKSNIKFQILKTVLSNGKIEFTKLQKNKKPFKLNIDKLNYTFYDMGTFRNTLASHSLNIMINKHTKLTVNGGLRIDPFKMHGKVKLKNLKPNELLAYKKDILNFNLDEKVFLDLEFGYKIDDTSNLKFEIDNAELNLQNVNIKQNKKTILSFKNLSVDNFNLKYPQNSIFIDSLHLNELNSKIINTQNGKINFSTLLIDIKDEKKKETRTEKQQAPWKVALNNLKIEKSNISYNDLTKSLFIDSKDMNFKLNKFKLVGEDYSLEKAFLSKPTIILKDQKNNLNITNKEVELTVNNLYSKKSVVNLKNINLKLATIELKDKENSLDILSNNISLNTQKLNLNKQNLKLEKIKLQTPILELKDIKNKIDVTAKNLNLIGTKSSLIEERLNIDILSLTKPTIYLEDRKNNRTIIANDISLKINDIQNYKDSIKVSKVNLKEPNITIKDRENRTNIIAKNIYIYINKILHKNNRLKINNSTISKPFLEIILEKQAKKEEQKEEKKKLIKKVSKKRKSTFHFDIGPIKIKDMKMIFQDQNLPIPFKTNITKLNGEFSRFSSNSKPMKLQLEGEIDKYGYTKITATVDIKDIKLLSNTNLLFKNIAIKNFTPYSGKFIGREIESGKLDSDLKYNIKSSDLKAENSIIIKDIKLGKKVQSPEAMNLPLELAIALLEDKNGVINIELPIRGNVDEPQFSIGHIVWKAFINLITKAITAPFSLLASIFGFDTEKIKNIEFEFGKSNIIASEKETLDNIAKILKEKPKLAIKIKPAYNPIKDRLALQNIKFDKFLEKKMEKIPQGDDYKELLEDLYEDLDDVEDLDEVKKSFISKNKKDEDILNKDAYVKKLKETLAGKEKVSDEELIEITKQRVVNINNYLIKEKSISKEAIKVEEIKKQTTLKERWSVFNLDIDTK